jgi:glycosyltransferase involved in cell wall biosynthesis
MKPLAIVTICFNDRSGLERTLDSVAAQTTDQVEHIVVDGGSTDGSVEVIKAHGSRLTRWVSEPDRGIYDAQNKGWRMASAPWVLFLNAGDTLHGNDVLECVLPELQEDVDIVYGDLQVNDEQGGWRVKAYPARITSAWLMKESLPHPAQFTRRTVLERLNGFDDNYRIVADYDLFARAFWKLGIRMRKLPLVVSDFTLGGLSSDVATTDQLLRERTEVQRRQAPRGWFLLYRAWATFNRLIGR